MVILCSLGRSRPGFHSLSNSSNNDACVSALVLPLLPHADLLGTGQPGTTNPPPHLPWGTCPHPEPSPCSLDRLRWVCALLYLNCVLYTVGAQGQGQWSCGLAPLLASSLVCEGVPATPQSCAHCRVRPSVEQGSLGWGMGLFSHQSYPCVLFPLVCPSLTSHSPVVPGTIPAEEQRVSCMSLRRMFCSGSALLYLSPCIWIIRPFPSAPAGPWWKQDG